MSRGGFITFYEDSNSNHSIGSRNDTGAEADDIRINTYGALYVNLDSNNNNTSGADFMIGRHGSATGTISELFRVSGENGNITVTGSLSVGATTAPVINKTFTLGAYSTTITDSLNAVGTQAKRFEIARVFFDYNDWQNTGVLEIELMESFFGQGISKKYQLVVGYNNYADMDLIEMSGGTQNQSFELIEILPQMQVFLHQEVIFI